MHSYRVRCCYGTGFLLHDAERHAVPAKTGGERQANRPGPHDQNIRVHDGTLRYSRAPYHACRNTGKHDGGGAARATVLLVRRR